jgi:predicted membrane protein
MVEMPQPQNEKTALSCAFAIAGVMITLVIYGFLQVFCHVSFSFSDPIFSMKGYQFLMVKLFNRLCNAIVTSLVQEKIMAGEYGTGDKKEKFTFSIFLVFCNRITTSTVSAAVLLVYFL